ncbi:DUF6128 domain-containing protein [Anaerocolumna jejuensis]|uniref:DUF6128 domain-containing protein n=1 Tax=Anaerocolumna jejuensis TaxID=259063 RepID=UPI003F7CADA2
MADYKRQVSYMYLYEEGKKRNNIGYARVETKNGQCKYTIHVTALGLNEKQLKVYAFRRKNSGIEGVLLGTLLVKNNTGDFKVMTDAAHIMNSPYGNEDMSGVVLLFSERKFFATEWDSKPITMAMVANINRKEERKHAKEAEKETSPVTEEQRRMKAANLAEVLFEHAKAPKEAANPPEPKEKVRDDKSLKDLLTPNINMVLKKEADLADLNEMDEEIPESLLQTKGQPVLFPKDKAEASRNVSDSRQKEEPLLDQVSGETQNLSGDTTRLPSEKKEAISELTEEIRDEAVLNPPEEETGKAIYDQEKVEAENSISNPLREKTEETIFNPQKEEMEKSIFNPQKEEAENPGSDTLKEKAEDTIFNSQKEEVEKAIFNPQTEETEKPIFEPLKEDVKEPIFNPLNGETDNLIFYPIREEAEKPIYNPQTGETVNSIYNPQTEEAKEPVYNLPTEEKEGPILSPPEAGIEEPIKNPPLEEAKKNQEGLEERKENREEGKAQEKGNPPELSARPVFEDHPLAKQIYHNFPKMYPFEDNEIAWCARIEPKDIGMLPMELWGLGNNSFLLHGYYSYRHLIFARVNDKTGQNYILGVPGIYHNREKFMAKMFGFENFKCAKRKPQRTGEFGYWYIPVLLNRQ